MDSSLAVGASVPASGALDVSQQLSSTAAGVGVSAASRAFGSDDAPLVSCGGGAGVGVSSAVPSAVGGDSTAPISRPPGEIIPIGGLPVVTPVSPQVAMEHFLGWDPSSKRRVVMRRLVDTTHGPKSNAASKL